MRTAGVVLGLAVLLTAACGRGTGDEVGFGTLTVTALDSPKEPGHFTAAPERVRAELGVTAQGCVTVQVDGVTRVAFWPAGTQVTDQAGTSTVRIPSGPTLTAGNTGGSVVEATGVIDADRTFIPDGYVGSYLGYCAVPSAPIAFRDAGTFRVVR